MTTPPFRYVRVGSYEEASRTLQEHGEEAKLLAGGQSLVPMMNLRLVRPSALVDLNAVPATPPALEGTRLRLGALTRHRQLLEDATIRRHSPLLAEAAWHIGNVRVRNRGTLAGSLAHADPTSELAACALVLEAEITTVGPRGGRTLRADELFVTYLTTSLGEAEVITGVNVPVKRPGEGLSFQEMVRRTSDLAIAAVAARVELDESREAVRGARLALAGVADRVCLAPDGDVEALLGSRGDSEAIGTVAAAVAAGVAPSSDVHASADYRKRLVGVLTRRALTEAIARARSPEAA